MVKYSSFLNSSFALRYVLLWLARRPQCDTPLVGFACKQVNFTLHLEYNLGFNLGQIYRRKVRNWVVFHLEFLIFNSFCIKITKPCYMQWATDSPIYAMHHALFAWCTNVAYVVGPSVNTVRAQLIFPSKPNFCNLFEFLATKSAQKSISFTP